MNDIMGTINLVYKEGNWYNRLDRVANVFGESYRTKENNLKTVSLVYSTALILGIFVGVIIAPYLF